MQIEQGRLSPLRSGAFRFALLFAAVFAVASAFLLLTVQRQIGKYAAEATDGMLRAEAAILAGEYRQMGLSGLTDALERHRNAGGEAQFSYLLLDAKGRKIAGNLPASVNGIGLGEIRTPAELGEGTEETDTLKRLGTRLPDGLQLVVATDTFDIRNLGTRLTWFTLWCGVGIAVFALIGGYLVGGLFLRRLDRVNAAVGRIMEGSGERLPTIGMGPEFDRLSSNLNRMLERNTALMDGLRQVSTDIAHDLRTPLTRLRQQLEDTRDAVEAGPGRAAIDDALAQTEDLLSIFQALLRIGTIEGGVGRKRFAPVDLTEVMNRVHLAYQPVAEDRGQFLTAELEHAATISGDGELLAQLFTNVVENALMHTPQGTRVIMRVATTPAGVISEIEDDGPGIPPREHGNVLRRFYRLDSSRNTPGAGLGLALVSAIAALHDAELSLVDKQPGLMVRLTFPPARSVEY